ncbi:unnamed protein product [Parnassius apollo]|uniref:(apollo) hypothetical protein n=1 Tax=Parnassius apollo TaxID=110799 RepID=A0A8S3XFQ7_PARAO|nr:unnamed protein product [Parnassius apollo]
MPRKSAIKCYFGCATEVSGPFHQFPKPEYPNLEKFEQWKMVLNEDVKTKGDSFIFNIIRICDCHFEEFYRSASKRLTGNAVPTLNLSSTSPIVLQPSSSVETEMDIDMQIGDNLEPFKLPYPKQKLLPRVNTRTLKRSKELRTLKARILKLKSKCKTLNERPTGICSFTFLSKS